MSSIDILSDFWIDKKENVFVDEFVDDTSENLCLYDPRLIKMGVVKKVISNFVNIITNKNIPIKYKTDSTDENFTDGQRITISDKVNRKKDFDVVVGLALHEGSHILLTDFNVSKNVWQHIPIDIFEQTRKLNIDDKKICEISQTIFNIVEDRYIDDFVYSTAIGYRGYYLALYERYYRSDQIDKMLQSLMYRTSSFDAYIARLINIMNKNTDLDALPDFRKISDLLNLNCISRLKTTQQRVDVAYDIMRIIVKNIVNEYDPTPSVDDKSDKKSEENNTTSDGKTYELNQDKKPMNNTGNLSDSKFSDVMESLQEIDTQKKLINGIPDKKSITNEQYELLNSIEKGGVSLINAGKDLKYDGGEYKGIDCILVKNMTKELILNKDFPLYADNRSHREDVFKSLIPSTIKTHTPDDIIQRGISKGIILGKKIRLRNETNTSKYLRKSNGRIDKRLLSEIGVDNEKIFFQSKIDSYDKVSLHISVDASGSMIGRKWEETMELTVAICKAASMCTNIDVSVSFRSSVYIESYTNYSLPYVILAYDSRVDKFSKVKNLFGLLGPGGATPDGLAFETLMDHLDTLRLNKEKYFINISDGQPYLISTYASGEKLLYHGKKAIDHTKVQVNKIKNKGYIISSYFISDEDKTTSDAEGFRKVYGVDSEFIRVDNVSSIIKSVNGMFIKSVN